MEEKYNRDDLVSYAQAGRLLDVTRFTVRDYVERGKLTAVRYGKRPYVLKSELAEFVKPSEWKKIRQNVVSSAKAQVTALQHDKPKEKEWMLGSIMLGIATGGIIGLIETAKKAGPLLVP